MKPTAQPAGTSYFPQKGFITFDQANAAAIIGRLRKYIYTDKNVSFLFLIKDY